MRVLFADARSPQQAAHRRCDDRGPLAPIYGVRILEELRRVGEVETHLVISKAGLLSAASGLDVGRRPLEALADVAHAEKDIGASIASGSFKTDGMIIAPCSMRTLAAIATGVSDNLVTPFYAKLDSLSAMIDQTVGRVRDLFGIDSPLVRRESGVTAPADD